MACIRMSLRSRVLDVDTVVNVVIPYDLFDREGRPKPFTRTLYLLHGLRQNADAWQRMSSAERFANYYGYALVMPDAQRSFYTDMAHGPRFFTYLTEELPEIMQAMFKIPADPAHTYVGGLSMGGYGALACGLSHPERFMGVGAFSSVADLRKFVLDDDYAGRKELRGWLKDRTGIYGEALDYPEAFDPYRLVDAANENGGSDNITALLLAVEPTEVHHG